MATVSQGHEAIHGGVTLERVQVPLHGSIDLGALRQVCDEAAILVEEAK
jgi:hypothetical protein